MRTFRCGLSTGIAAAFLAGCGGSQAQIGAPNVLSLIPSRAMESRTRYTVIYSFDGGTDGANPQASLIAFKGSLYGTTATGGYGPSRGNGTVFKMSPSGNESVLYRFKGYPNDGSFPAAGLIAAYDTFYGTSASGGGGNCYSASSNLIGCGTIFKVARSGKESVLHQFLGGPDGSLPDTILTGINGVFYGTTSAGGTGSCVGNAGYGCGTVFKIDLSGKGYKVLYSFKGGGDGAHPSSGLIDVNGVLYGLTSYGGKCGASQGCGTFFAITPHGTEHVLYRFPAGRNGQSQTPSGNLLNVNGKLYGTMYVGGATGSGTVFDISTSGKLHTVYNFKGGLDGDHPYGSLMLRNGVLYGTTNLGGARNRNHIGCGTIFSVRASGVETVLHRFARINGCYPSAGLVPRNGALYGTTANGGAADSGTVFEFTP